MKPMADLGVLPKSRRGTLAPHKWNILGVYCSFLHAYFPIIPEIILLPFWQAVFSFLSFLNKVIVCLGPATEVLHIVEKT